LSITVLCELRSRPDEVEAMIQRSIEQVSLPSGSVAGRRLARLYQRVDDPARLLYLAEWSSREAFEAYRRPAPTTGTPDPIERLPACRLYQRLALFERVLTPVPIVHATIVEGAAETHTARRDVALAYHRSGVRGRTELVLLQVHEAIDGVPGLLIVSGWEGIAPLPRAGQDLEQALLDQLAASGGTTQRFVGRALVESTGT
jgi:quinol monooxygenase YgiN